MKDPKDYPTKYLSVLVGKEADILDKRHELIHGIPLSNKLQVRAGYLREAARRLLLAPELEMVACKDEDCDCKGLHCINSDCDVI